VQNILLPAIDERMISIPRLGEVRAGDAFLVIATQNPKEFVATSHLSEAILDRFELVILDYQSESEEVAIVNSKVQERGHGAASADLVKAAVSLVRMTRNHSRIRRGASVRAAISTTEIAAVLMEEGLSLEDAFLKAVLMALPTRIEFEREAQPGLSPRSEIEGLLTEWAAKALGEASHTHLKKKP
jgi:MoxR-like ATPase